MQTSDQTLSRTSLEALSPRFCGGYVSFLWPLLLAATLMLSACGGSSTPPQNGPQVAGNWQFNLTPPSDFYGDPNGASPKSFLQGGFLVQKNGSVTGQAVFSIWPSGSTTSCNSGTATVTGTVSGQTVNLTAVVGTLDQNGDPTTQTITLAGGQLSPDNSSVTGTNYSFSTDGYYVNPSSGLQTCGLASDAGTWSATSVPPLTGGFQGFFHSTTNSSGDTYSNQDFPVSGTLIQGENIGAKSASVTGELVFRREIPRENMR